VLNIPELGYDFPRFVFPRPAEIDQEHRKIMPKAEARAQS
jgi:hypothetical protein